jgi:SAM-dependent methyltransferase
MSAIRGLICPVCAADATFEFLRRPSVPVHQNLLLDDHNAACGLTRGDLVMRLCQGCGFGFNAAFRADLLDYGHNYDNTQNCSSAFDTYVDDLVRDLVEVHGVRGCRVVEVGCGKGAFLKKLVAYPGANNIGHGFDPSYVGPDIAMDGRLRFSRSFYDGNSHRQADIVVCRHVIEHVREPLDLLRSVRRGLAAGARVYFETPCLEWILRHQVMWDFFYEHCSLFTSEALTSALMRAGFGAINVRHAFAGQYLWAHARCVSGSPVVEQPVQTSRLQQLAQSFSRQEQARVRSWRELASQWAKAGDVAVWGAGAKGVTFCNLIDPLGKLLPFVIDVNPAKQGKFLAGSGHRIVGPDHLRSEDVAAILVLNPMYIGEIARLLKELNSRAVLVDAMRLGGHKACA